MQQYRNQRVINIITLQPAMRIAQVSPLFESVPPKLYGGTERVVYYLTEELVKLGHEVTLFASGDSCTSARLVPVCSESLRLNKSCEDQLAHHFVMMERIISEIPKFDIIHYHIDYLHFPLSRRLSNVTHLTTLHGRLNIPDLVPLYKEYREIPVVSISNSQRKPLAWINWQGTVYHGISKAVLRLDYGSGGYLAFLGRISPEKRVDRAIEIAKMVGLPLKIAAKVDKRDEEYFVERIKPLIDGQNIQFLGEIGENEKQEFLGSAKALLFPIDWPEPFGLVMVESIACGTPVVAFNQGSVPEIIDEGITGFIVNSVAEAAEAVKKLDKINRIECRKMFENRFTAERMALDYLELYQNLIENCHQKKDDYKLTAV